MTRLQDLCTECSWESCVTTCVILFQLPVPGATVYEWLTRRGILRVSAGRMHTVCR
jgi:hypothetical protein